jgi:hypothetical protein
LATEAKRRRCTGTILKDQSQAALFEVDERAGK